MFLFILLEKTQGNSPEGFTEQQWWWDTRGLPAFEGEQRAVRHPWDLLWYRKLKFDNRKCRLAIPTWNSNDFHKKSKEGVTIVLYFHFRQNKLSHQDLWPWIFTFFSFPFPLMCFLSHCLTFPAYCFSDLSLAPFSSHPLIHYEVWSLQQCFQRKHVTSTLECLWSCVNKCIEKE